MSHKVSYKWFRRTQYITSIGLFYKEVGRLWRVSDCEELVGVTHRRWWGWFYDLRSTSFLYSKNFFNQPRLL